LGFSAASIVKGAKNQHGSESVMVCVRVKPLLAGATEDEQAWNLDPLMNRLSVKSEQLSMSSIDSVLTSSTSTTPMGSISKRLGPVLGTTFDFDHLALGSSSAPLYDALLRPLTTSVIQGFNATIFAYGQTASGKTWTLMGDPQGGEEGVIVRALVDLFAQVDSFSSAGSNDGNEGEHCRDFEVSASYLEIYNESLKDLLADPVVGVHAEPKIMEDTRTGKTIITPLVECPITKIGDVSALLARGDLNRHTSATDWNQRSSRSHCVFQVSVKSCALQKKKRYGAVRSSQLSLIDLAGSERAASLEERRREGAYINRSLLTLATVIARLGEIQGDSLLGSAAGQNGHIPYRDSKLTRLLAPSLGGNARVAVICCINSSWNALEESISTLKFAKRVKKVKVNATRGDGLNEPGDEVMRLKRENERLKMLLVEMGGRSESCTLDVRSPSSLSNHSMGSSGGSLDLDTVTPILYRTELDSQLSEIRAMADEAKSKRDRLVQLDLTCRTFGVDLFTPSKNSLGGRGGEGGTDSLALADLAPWEVSCSEEKQAVD